MQLIHGGKTSKSLPRYRFPKGFQKVSVVKQRELLKCQVDQKALVIMDVFTGQMTVEMHNAYEEANILIINVPANMTKYYQPLDLTFNG